MSAVESLTTLLDHSAVSSLAVTDQGYPSVSLVPYVVLRDPLRLFVLISDLASHTASLRQDPRCSLMMHEPPHPEDPRSNHALTRVTFKAKATFLSRAEAVDLGVESLYRQKYEIAKMILDLKDFHFCQIVPQEGSFIRGFGQAYRLSGPNLETLEPISRN